MTECAFVPMPPVPEELRDQIPSGHMDGGVYVRPDYTGSPYRPLGEWTKAAVLDAIADAGYSEAVALVVRGMPLADIRVLVLTCIGWMYRGKPSYLGTRQGRRAEFYGLNRDYLDALTVELRRCR